MAEEKCRPVSGFKQWPNYTKIKSMFGVRDDGRICESDVEHVRDATVKQYEDSFKHIVQGLKCDGNPQLAEVVLKQIDSKEEADIKLDLLSAVDGFISERGTTNLLGINLSGLATARIFSRQMYFLGRMYHYGPATIGIELEPLFDRLSPPYSDVRLHLKPRGICVKEVERGSPAVLAGIKKDDVIIKIDGIPVTQLTILDAAGRLYGSCDSRVVLTLQRGTQRLDVTVTRRLRSEVFRDGRY